MEIESRKVEIQTGPGTFQGPHPDGSFQPKTVPTGLPQKRNEQWRTHQQDLHAERRRQGLSGYSAPFDSIAVTNEKPNITLIAV
jgi:hypothetical protein